MSNSTSSSSLPAMLKNLKPHFTRLQNKTEKPILVVKQDGYFPPIKLLQGETFIVDNATNDHFLWLRSTATSQRMVKLDLTDTLVLRGLIKMTRWDMP